MLTETIKKKFWAQYGVNLRDEVKPSLEYLKQDRLTKCLSILKTW